MFGDFCCLNQLNEKCTLEGPSIYEKFPKKSKEYSNRNFHSIQVDYEFRHWNL